MDTQAEIERLKAFVAETNRRTALVNAYADSLEKDVNAKKKKLPNLGNRLLY